MELYVARHGETIANIEYRIAGRKGDSPLTEKGIEQAKKLGISLEDIGFDAIYCSPLKRAFETAKIAFGDKYKIYLDERLEEIDVGVMEGLKYAEATEKFPESGMLFFTNPVLYKVPMNGESLEEMINRVNLFLDELVKKSYNKVFVLTHGFALRVLYSCMKDKSIMAIVNSPYYSNCEVFKYIFDGNKLDC